MKYRQLGNTGLQVSEICLGCMSYGDPDWRPWILDESAARQHFKVALDNGINFFDTADMYSEGRSEEITGKLLRESAARNDYVLATKVFFPVGDGHAVWQPVDTAKVAARIRIVSEVLHVCDFKVFLPRRVHRAAQPTDIPKQMPPYCPPARTRARRWS